MATSATKLPRPMNRLHSSLQEELKEFLKERHEVLEQEKPYVMGFIASVFNSSNNYEDYIVLLPDSVHAPIEDTRKYFSNTCVRLTESEISQFKEKHNESISLLKKRLIMNLLI